ncbi:hypothetical protein [Anaeromyxobacter terrae]|uniref:hypothetical protein n=1 Tax=Anaeromyxobacter terrae TaxID=2925406 RepID=UPI001F5999A0|nr:hypothetical protein [Anaeromyxobacter sp. SG22]
MSRFRIVLQAYGLDEVRVGALYAAWSALAYAEGAPLAIHVYTDEPGFFAPLGDALVLRELSRDDISAWRGPLDFTHRLKAVMIREMTRRHPADPLLYLDADTFFAAPVGPVFERITPSTSVMHEREYSVATRDSGQIQRFRKHMGRLSFRGAPVDLGGDMWNAGAVGIHPSNFPVVDSWLEFIDTLYPSYRRGLVEQYGISLLLQRSTAVSPCADEVFHYWAQKDEYCEAIRRELDLLRGLGLAESLRHLRERRIALPPPARRRHKQSMLDRVRRALGMIAS